MMTPVKPFEEQDIVEKCLIRAEIRRKIGRTKDGKPDRIAETCEEAAAEIIKLRQRIDEIVKLHAEIADLKEEEYDNLAEECLDEIAAAVKQFGTYSYDDKGPGEVMEVYELVRKFRVLDVKAAAHSLRILGNSPRLDGRGERLASCIIGEMEDWDELFEQPGIPELY